MANVAKLLPLVPATDGGVFKSAVSHHCALRTSNILRAMKFYSLLGMNEVCFLQRLRNFRLCGFCTCCLDVTDTYAAREVL